MADRQEWRKSSHSGQGDCVEARQTARGMAVRDSKDPDGRTLAVGRAAWRSFIQSVKHQRT